MSVPIGRLFLSSSLVDPRAPLPRSTPRAGGRRARRAHERPREARGARCAVGRRAGVRAPRALGESAVPKSLLLVSWHDPSQGSGSAASTAAGGVLARVLQRRAVLVRRAVGSCARSLVEWPSR